MGRGIRYWRHCCCQYHSLPGLNILPSLPWSPSYSSPPCLIPPTHFSPLAFSQHLLTRAGAFPLPLVAACVTGLTTQNGVLPFGTLPKVYCTAKTHIPAAQQKQHKWALRFSVLEGKAPMPFNFGSRVFRIGKSVNCHRDLAHAHGS